MGNLQKAPTILSLLAMTHLLLLLLLLLLPLQPTPTMASDPIPGIPPTEVPGSSYASGGHYVKSVHYNRQQFGPNSLDLGRAYNSRGRSLSGYGSNSLYHPYNSYHHRDNSYNSGPFSSKLFPGFGNRYRQGQQGGNVFVHHPEGASTRVGDINNKDLRIFVNIPRNRPNSGRPIIPIRPQPETDTDVIDVDEEESPIVTADGDTSRPEVVDGNNSIENDNTGDINVSVSTAAPKSETTLNSNTTPLAFITGNPMSFSNSNTIDYLPGYTASSTEEIQVSSEPTTTKDVKVDNFVTRSAPETTTTPTTTPSKQRSTKIYFTDDIVDPEVNIFGTTSAPEDVDTNPPTVLTFVTTLRPNINTDIDTEEQIDRSIDIDSIESHGSETAAPEIFFPDSEEETGDITPEIEDEGEEENPDVASAELMPSNSNERSEESRTRVVDSQVALDDDNVDNVDNNDEEDVDESYESYDNITPDVGITENFVATTTRASPSTTKAVVNVPETTPLMTVLEMNQQLRQSLGHLTVRQAHLLLNLLKLLHNPNPEGY